MKMVFWISVIAVGYSYFIFPLVLFILSKIFKKKTKPIKKSENLPMLSLIITAHNEQNRINEKLQNSLEIDYPQERLEIIVASDHSTDKTDEIVKSMEDKGISFVRADERKGKEYAQWLAVQQAKGDILIFSDVATHIPKTAFFTLVDLFSDPKVGAVSSEDKFITEDGKIVGEGLYVRYEMWLRKLESRLAGLVGLSGSFFAARHQVCEKWDILAPSDFNIALNCVTNDFMAISDSRLVGIYKDVKDSKQEYQRKVRTVIRGITALYRKPGVLNPFEFGLFAFQVWGHKIMRWLVPWFMLSVLLTSIYLYKSCWIYSAAVWMQCLFYGLVLSGFISENLRNKVIIKIPYYFVQANIAVAHATIAFILGKRIMVWTPSTR